MDNVYEKDIMRFIKLLEDLRNKIKEANIVFTDKDLGTRIESSKGQDEFYSEFRKLLMRPPQDEYIKGALDSIPKLLAIAKGGAQYEGGPDEHEILAFLQEYTKDGLAWVFDVNNTGDIVLVKDSEVENYV